MPAFELGLGGSQLSVIRGTFCPDPKRRANNQFRRERTSKRPVQNVVSWSAATVGTASFQRPLFRFHELQAAVPDSPQQSPEWSAFCGLLGNDADHHTAKRQKGMETSAISCADSYSISRHLQMRRPVPPGHSKLYNDCINCNCLILKKYNDLLC